MCRIIVRSETFQTTLVSSFRTTKCLCRVQKSMRVCLLIGTREFSGSLITNPSSKFNSLN